MVSVIIPIYNAEKYIESCINQLRDQTFVHFELILVDDGSTDRSGVICDQYALIDHRIKVVHKKNGGASDARNKGIDVASAEYICFVDIDDFVEKSYLAELYNDFINYSNIDLVIQCFIQKWDKKTKVYKLPNNTYIGNISGINNLFLDIDINDFGGPYCKLFRRKIIEENHIRFSSNIIYGEDYDFLIRYMPFCRHIRTSSVSNYIYLMHQGSVSSKIYSFEQEYRGLSQLSMSYGQLMNCFPGEHIKNKFNETIVVYTRRVLDSIYRSKYSRRQRIINYKSISNFYIANFRKNFHPASNFMFVVKFLFTRKMFNALDFLLYLRLVLLQKLYN